MLWGLAPRGTKIIVWCIVRGQPQGEPEQVVYGQPQGEPRQRYDVGVYGQPQGEPKHQV